MTGWQMGEYVVLGAGLRGEARWPRGATNPVQNHLVERVHHWPGGNGLARLMAGR